MWSRLKEFLGLRSDSAFLKKVSVWGITGQKPEKPETIVKVIPQPSDDLSSDRGIDYTRLRDLLAGRNWLDADDETYLVMLQVVGSKDGDWIESEELLNFKSTDLRTIDSLWVKYSNGRFGFSVQKKIYLEVGGIADGEFYKEAWLRFGSRVGWRLNSIGTDEVNLPDGHFPLLEDGALWGALPYLEFKIPSDHLTLLFLFSQHT